jgi:hypothetical protein
VLWASCAPALPQAASAESSISCAATNGTNSHQYYLTGKEEALLRFPKAPSLGSPTDLTDLAIILSIQSSRTPEQIAEAKLDSQYSIKLMTDVIDPSFPTSYPATFALLEHVNADEVFIMRKLKKQNGRLRPYVQHPTLVIPVVSAKEFSYPSGHSSGAELQARLLGKLFPAKAEDLLRRARQIADSRVVAGVHYASDITAGLTLGDILFNELESNPKFRIDLVKAEAQDKISPR